MCVERRSPSDELSHRTPFLLPLVALRRFAFVSPSEAYALEHNQMRDSDRLVHSTDGGRSWKPMKIRVPFKLFSFAAEEDTSGYSTVVVPWARRVSACSSGSLIAPVDWRGQAITAVTGNSFG